MFIFFEINILNIFSKNITFPLEITNKNIFLQTYFSKQLIMKNIYFLAIILFLFACGESANEKTSPYKNMAAQLQNEKTVDSLLLANLSSEIAVINGTLDSASSINSNFKSSKTISKKDALAKIKYLDSMLVISEDKAERLKMSLINSESKLRQNTLVISTVTEKQSEIAEQRKFYEKLKTDILKLRTDNVNLKAIIKQQEDDLVAKSDVISRIKAERHEQELKLSEVKQKVEASERRIMQAEKEIEMTKKEAVNQQANLFYETAQEFKKRFDVLDDKAISIGTGQTRKDLIKQAHFYFKKSYELGNPDAKREMLVLETDKKYSKFLKEDK